MNSREMNSCSKVCQKKDVYLTELDDDRVMMDLNTGNYYVLNGMGSIIWDKIHDKIHISQLVQELLEEYDVEPDICEGQVMNYLKELQQINLVVVEN